MNRQKTNAAEFFTQNLLNPNIQAKVRCYS